MTFIFHSESRNPSGSFSPSLFRDSKNLLAAESLAIAAALISQVILTRGISQHDYGSWIIIFDLSMVSFMFLDPGISTIVGREIQNELESARQVVKSTLLIQLSLAVVVLPIVLLIVLDELSSESKMPKFPATLLSLAAFNFCLTSSHKAFLRSVGYSSIEAIIRVLDRTFLLIGYSFLWFTEGDLLDYCIMIFSIQILTLISVIYACFYASSKIEEKRGGAVKSKHFTPGELFRRATPFFIFMALMQLTDRVDKIFLTFHSNPEDIATYGVALLVFFAGMSITRILRGVMLPWFGASIYSHEELSNKLLLSSNFTSVIAPIGLIFSLLIFELLVPKIFPNEYLFPLEKDFTSLSIFHVLIVSWALSMISSPFLEIIRATRNAKTVNLIHFSGLICGLIVAWFTVPRFGVYGAAFSMIAPQIVFVSLFARELILGKSEIFRIPHVRSLLFSIICAISPYLFFFSEVQYQISWGIILIVSILVTIRGFNQLRESVPHSL